MEQTVQPLTDGFGRRFEYLRLSLTDVCNFRCSYCLPDGYRKAKGLSGDLSLAEIRRLLTAFATLGLWKVRLTGGEPTLREDFVDVARTVAAVPGITRVAMTTNGYRLVERAASYAEAGVSAINISIDSLDAARFADITGHDRLAEVLAGVEAARAAGFSTIKLNCVLMRGVNADEVGALVDFAAERDLSLRFIEVMRTNDNPDFYAQRHVGAELVTSLLDRRGWSRLPRRAGDGPAIEYGRSDARGRVGVIAPYSRDFCATCNRLRVSSRGKLHLCLFGDAGIDVRPLLESDDQHDDLVARLRALTMTKAAAHHLHEGSSGGTANLSAIGG
ncbi:molybdenum cofactor biosynthesis protein A [Novosphingobium nitrogenifigens DSM 19370]|uniref:GTP 3',8-cyclase n=1 Tax=Novosphingobium nitrogenifigens DSM 19370 TaxID=983920 RepID=F1Z788_9SPHN|nr:GTP 3',8-cyclase MoaA [Novosphingobium nitrogenifigens]EGD59506.1 molybdenum cofactor biosynthesis protein A [Novosphingobium nitrogenifigens DSM 19370]